MNIFTAKFREVIPSILPITLIGVILHFTLTPMETPVILRFLFGALLVMIGLIIFLAGVDLAVSEIGDKLGSLIARTGKLTIILVVGFVLGFIISIAEPDLHILAQQVERATAGGLSRVMLVVAVSLGIGVIMSLGIVRSIKAFPLYKFFTITYIIILAAAIFSEADFLAISFDSSGATTGAMTVPFMIALAMGATRGRLDSKGGEKDSFGLVGISSAGAIIAVLILGLFRSSQESGSGSSVESLSDPRIFGPFRDLLGHTTGEILLSLAPIALIFIIANILSFRLPAKQVRRISSGLVLTFVGLIIFMVGVNGGFSDLGREVGSQLASMDNKLPLILVAFVLGVVTILAEPAVHVLTHQIEDVTGGYVNRRSVFASLTVGVGAAVAMSMIRILVPGLALWHFLLPGYIIAIGLMYIVPKIFIGMAFDSGGVASGPMSATFILAFAQGAANQVPHADVLIDGFGIIAMIAMTPVIALQLMGLVYKLRADRNGKKETA